MKKQNKTSFPLKKLGIYKRFDKCVVYECKDDAIFYYIVLYYANKPFTSWSIEKVRYNLDALNVAVDCCIKYYNWLDLNSRRNSKRLAKNFIERSADNVVKVFK